MGVLVWQMDLETAEEFYTRCMDRNAVTEDERVEILIELANEGRMKSVSKTDRTADQVAEDMSKKFGDVLYFKPNTEKFDDNNG